VSRCVKQKSVVEDRCGKMCDTIQLTSGVEDGGDGDLHCGEIYNPTARTMAGAVREGAATLEQEVLLLW
jgi:hypothetical protein